MAYFQLSTYVSVGNLNPWTDAMSISDARTTIPSSITRQASFTTGKNIISRISSSVTDIGCRITQQNHAKPYITRT